MLSSAQILTSLQDLQTEISWIEKLMQWSLLDSQKYQTYWKVIWTDQKSCWIHLLNLFLKLCTSSRKLYRLVKSFHYWYEFLLLNLNSAHTTFLSLFLINFEIHLCSTLIWSVQISILSNLSVQKLYILDIKLHRLTSSSEIRQLTHNSSKSFTKNLQLQNMLESFLQILHTSRSLWNSFARLWRMILCIMYSRLKFCTD